MFINKKSLMRLIEEAVDRALLEQEEPDAPAPTDTPVDTPADAPATPETTPTSPTGTTGTAPTGDAAAGAATDAGIEPGVAAGAPGAGGIPGGEGVPGEEGTADDAAAGAGGGGFAGFTSGGGGGGFGDDGKAGLDADQPEEEEAISTVGPEDVEIPADPVMAIVDDAIQLLNQTRQPQVILANVKSSIQRYFPEIEDATPVIKNLWDTEDVVLRDVARRLLLFIKGI